MASEQYDHHVKQYRQYWASHKLLVGWPDKRGNQSYFDRGSREEQEARLALAELLRRVNPPSEFLHLIAGLIDPNASFAARKIVFQNRHAGWKNKSAQAAVKHFRIGVEMLKAWSGGKELEEIKEGIGQKYGFERRHIDTIWSGFAKFIKKPKA